GGDCLVVITSRNRLAGLSYDGVPHRLTLGPLATEHALELLGTDRVNAEPEAAVRLVDLCDRLPLALAIVAELLDRNERLADAVRSLSDEGCRLDLLDCGEDDPRTQLRTVFSWSYRWLDKETAQ